MSTLEAVDLLDLDADDAVADDADFAEVDVGLTDDDVVRRIEEVVAGLILDVSEGRVPNIQLLSRSKVHASLAQLPSAHRFDAQSLHQSATPPGQHQAGPTTLLLNSRESTRDILHNQGASTFAFARVFQVLELAHELLRTGRQATQRDVYYKLLKPPLFATPRDVNAAIQDVVALLRVPRDSLAICCASRGAVSGCIYLRDGPTGTWQDCTTLGMSGRAISGDLRSIERLSFQCSARYLLVIEKDAVFQRLTGDRFFESLPVVMITAKGMPDLATRVFARRLLDSFPALVPLGLVDWNPSGVQILMTYKFGASAMGLEAHRHTLSGLHWLGVRRSMLANVPLDALQPLTTRDAGMLARLKALLDPHEPAWASELAEMASLGAKADIEALYHGAAGVSGLVPALTAAIVRADYV